MVEQDDRKAAEQSYERVISYLEALIAFFTGGSQLDDKVYQLIRHDLMRNPDYDGLGPRFVAQYRDPRSLWSYAKEISPSWEPRRKYLREQFEPLLRHLETVSLPQELMPPSYDSSAWTGVQSAGQRLKAVKTLIPLAHAAVGALIYQLEQPTSNGGPRLDEVEDALRQLKLLYAALGGVIDAADSGELFSSKGEGLMAEAARYGKRAAKVLKHDPMPYATAGTILGLMVACGFNNISGFLVGVALSIRKSTT